MIKILPLILVLFFSVGLLYAEEVPDALLPVVLEENAIFDEQKAEVEFLQNESEESLSEKKHDLYSLEAVDTNTINYLFREKLTKTFREESALDDVHFWGAYNGDWGLNFIEGGALRNHYEFNALSLGSDWKLKDNNADFRLMVNFSPLSSRTFIRNVFSDVYVGTNKIPHHRIQVGNFRPATGMEGKRSAYLLPFVTRSQISKHYGTVRKIGGKVVGDYDLIDYDLGFYSSDTYFKSFFPGTEFSGWVNVKPFGKTDGKYGNLKIGGGLEKGRLHKNYCVTGAYAGYEYKKFSADFEWANADGYNGAYGHSKNHSSGYYATVGYKLTPKLEALVRYDDFDPNKNKSHNKQRQYWAGLNYYIKGPALRLMLNYVFCQNHSQKNSHRIILGAQILL